MLIVHIISGLNIGGTELALKRLIESHQGNPNYCHAVISLTGIGKVGPQLQALGIDVQALGMQSPLDIPRSLWQLVRQLRETRPDIVQTWMYHADLLGGLAARITGNRNVIWGIRATDVKNGNSRVTAIARQVCAWLSHWVPHTIVCVAEYSRQKHVTVGYDAARIRVVPNGVDLAQLVATSEQRQVLRAQYGIGDNEIVIGSLGRFNAAKDQGNFVNAAGLLAHQNPHVRFLMVGRDLDTSNKELARWIAQSGHADRFVLLGERTDVAACLSAMDIFCLHSRTEGFPNVVGEAMGMGLPCVVTDVGDAAMLVADTGVVMPKEDSVALAQGLARLLAMPVETRRQLGLKAKARIHEEFTMERTRECFEAIYQQVTGHITREKGMR